MTLPDALLAAQQRRRVLVAAGIGGLLVGGTVWLVGAWLAAISSDSTWIDPRLPLIVGGSVPIASICAWWFGRSLRVVGFEAGDLLYKRFGRTCRIQVDERVRVLRWRFVGVPIYSFRSAGRFWGRWAVAIGFRPGQLDALFAIRAVEIEDRDREECQGS